ncbi:hypothetical protein E4T56_gene17462, partial [Termitomyces sp. T112]
YLPNFYVDPHLDLLVILGFISKQGKVNKQTVSGPQSWRRTLTGAKTTLGSIVSKEKDPKGKGKVVDKDDKDIAINPANVPLPDNNALDKEFKDLLKFPWASAIRSD